MRPGRDRAVKPKAQGLTQGRAWQGGAVRLEAIPRGLLGAVPASSCGQSLSPAAGPEEPWRLCGL